VGVDMKQTIIRIICILLVTCVVTVVTVKTFEIKEYPLSKMQELGIPYFDLREIENLPNACDSNGTGESYRSGLPIGNLVRIHKALKLKKHIEIRQTIIYDDYRALLTYSYSEGRFETSFEKFVKEENFIPYHRTAEIINDERFDDLMILNLKAFDNEEASLLLINPNKTEVAICARRGLKAIAITYYGNLDVEFFLDKIDEIL